MNRYLAMSFFALGLAISAPRAARAAEFWLSPYSEARDMIVSHVWVPQVGQVIHQVLLWQVTPWTAPVKGVEYESYFIAGTTRTRTLTDVIVIAQFESNSPCPTADACTVYLCRPNVHCAQLNPAALPGGILVQDFAGQKWRGGDELWFSLAYQVHGTGPITPMPRSKDERVVIHYTDG